MTKYRKPFILHNTTYVWIDMNKENVIREIPKKDVYVLPSEINITYFKNLRSKPEIETLKQSVLRCGIERPIIVVKDKFGNFYALDGVTKTLIAREVEKGLHLKPDGTPYTLEDINWRILVDKKPFEEYDEISIGKAKLRYNLSTPNKLDDPGNFVYSTIAPKIAIDTFGKPLDDLSRKERHFVINAAKQDLLADGTFSENYINKSVKLAVQKGLRNVDEEMEEIISEGKIKDSNILSQLQKVPKSPQKKEIVNIIRNMVYRDGKKEDVKQTQDIRNTLEFLRQNYARKKFPLEDYANEFRKRLPIQHTLKNKLITNIPKELLDNIFKRAKETKRTRSEVIIEALDYYFNKYIPTN